MTRKASVLFVLMVVAFAGCQSTAVNVSPPNVPMRYVTDDLGRNVRVPVNITRVVSTAPSITEMIFAAGGGDRLVGVTTFCDYPAEAKSIAKIGDTMTPNMETIVALKPDVVFVSTASQLETFTRTLEQNGIAVYVTNQTSLEGVFEGLVELADLLGTGAQAADAVSALKRRVGAVWDKVGGGERARVFVQISKEPLFTIGREAFLNAVLVKAGTQSVTSEVETAYPKLSKETALSLRPDVIILSDSPDNQEPNEVFRNSPAVKNGRVYKVNADILSRPGPRLVDALEQIARLLHPEAFAR